MSDDAILLAQIDARMNRLDAALNKAVGASNAGARRIERRFQSMNANLDRGFQRLQRGATVALGALGVGLSVRAFTEATNGALDLAETLQDTADRVGVTVEQLQELRYGADQTGASAATMDMALQRFARRTAEAAEGTGVLRDMLQRHNIELRDSNGNLRASYDVLMDYADAIANAESNQEALLLANRAFDTEGTRLVGLFRRGSEGVAQFAERLREAGGVLGNDMVRQGADANARLREMRQIIETQLNGAILSNVSELENMARMLGEVQAAAINVGAALARAFGMGGGIAQSDSMQAADLLEGRAAQLLNRNISATDRGGEAQIRATLRYSLGGERAQQESERIGEIITHMRAGEARGIDYGRTIDDAVAERLLVLAATIRRAPPQQNSGAAEGSGAGAGQTDLEAERGRALAVTRQQLALQLQLAEAEARGDSDAARRAQRELDTLSRIETYRRAQISDAEATARADQARLHGLEDDARAQERANQLIEARLELSARQLEIDLALARARGDEGLVRSLERELEIRTRIAQLTAAGFSTGEATDVATGEVDAMRAAIDQGQFRDAFRTAFRDGLLGALDGNAKEAFSNWMRDAATRGLSRALDALADQLFGLFAGAGGGGGGAGGIFSGVGKMLGFGGGKATGGAVRPGMAYAVGERGREIFAPSVPGNIIPAGQVSGAAASRERVVERVVVVKVDASPYFDTAVDERAAPMAQAAGNQAVEVSRSAVSADMQKRQHGRLGR
ncbi:hypothetical protein X907_1569 [Glycocaulis alkaliphilus]|uniref:Uncharacterized protein n=1 Tax=Glycocaulis alkaliphilus TaxID=1434191 RepID=A0A3T0E9N7_9PROT|nr:hypothetical protein [Glycocaulis alkaliphilus]AZU04101.1 hypothetical protein X907_1569 [Glycocaulis alkaliphilus]GGB75873.1 hypothetical protein GCM10007417_14580 [Glycocaulis alkaliphilus]